MSALFDFSKNQLWIFEILKYIPVHIKSDTYVRMECDVFFLHLVTVLTDTIIYYHNDICIANRNFMCLCTYVYYFDHKSFDILCTGTVECTFAPPCAISQN